MSNKGNGLAEVLANHQEDLLADWIREQTSGSSRTAGAIKESEVREQSKEFLTLLNAAVNEGPSNNLQTARWKDLREMLANLSRAGIAGVFSIGDRVFRIFLQKALVSSSPKPLFPGCGCLGRTDLGSHAAS